MSVLLNTLKVDHPRLAEPVRPFVLVALSGGVDSAVAAYLLKKEGYWVEAAFMINWQDDDSSEGKCRVSQDLADAEAVARALEIKLHVVNFSKEYAQRVFEHFLNELALGRTPNPDVWCNKEIKFKTFKEYAITLGAEYFATGHYARVLTQDDHRYLLKGVDGAKDQSYFLYRLDQLQLKNTLFPLGELTKTKVRRIARDLGLPNSEKKDSTGICFIGERNFRKFLQNYFLLRPGRLIDQDGNQLGEHQGLVFYTIGQRKGLGIGGRRGGDESPWYVIEKDLANNTLIVAQDQNHPRLQRSELTCNQLQWIGNSEPKFPYQCCAKIRYRQPDQECVLEQNNQRELKVIFAKPQWAVAAGQSIVFYQGDQCLGGGIIAMN